MKIASMILIGNNLFIEELPIDYSGKLLKLNPYIAPLNTFLISSVSELLAHIIKTIEKNKSLLGK